MSSRAERCPVCYGSGKYGKSECHGCGGKGWVVVPQMSYQPYPAYPPLYPWPWPPAPPSVWPPVYPPYGSTRG